MQPIGLSPHPLLLCVPPKSSLPKLCCDPHYDISGKLVSIPCIVHRLWLPLHSGLKPYHCLFPSPCLRYTQTLSVPSPSGFFQASRELNRETDFVALCTIKVPLHSPNLFHSGFSPSISRSPSLSYLFTKPDSLCPFNFILLFGIKEIKVWRK